MRTSRHQDGHIASFYPNYEEVDCLKVLRPNKDEILKTSPELESMTTAHIGTLQGCHTMQFESY